MAVFIVIRRYLNVTRLFSAQSIESFDLISDFWRENEHANHASSPAQMMRALFGSMTSPFWQERYSY
jgi:hypothetical protein